MRDILFRGKDTETGEWIDGFYVCLNGKEHRIYSGFAETDCGDYYPDFWKVAPETVGQFTGLTDKNGKKIFEGDIVRVQDNIITSPFCDGIIGKIVYDECAFFIEPKNPMDSQRLFNECAEYEVIGNIHDNPELLEAEDG